MRKDSPLFVCYSPQLRDFFMSKGERYEVVGLSISSGSKFWVFFKTPALLKALREWDCKDKTSNMKETETHEESRNEKDQC